MSAVLETKKGSVRAVLQSMREAACRAPSGDNIQPWRFEMGSDRLDIHLDAERDPSPMNAGQCMSLVACGAAAELASIAARAMGWNTQIEIGTVSEAATLAASVRLTEPASKQPSDFNPELIRARVTNRRMYDGRVLSPETLSSIQSMATSDADIRMYWICEREPLLRLSDLIARSDGVFFGNATIRRAFLKNVRFDLPAMAEAEEGLPLGALELSAADGIALRSLKLLPASLFWMTGGSALFANHARKLVRGSSGLCIATAERSLVNPEVSTGRAMLRAWLALTANGLAVQPMMTLPGLDNSLRYGVPDLVSALGVEARQLLDQFSTELSGMGIEGRTVFLLRFGYAAPPSGRAGRLKAQD